MVISTHFFVVSHSMGKPFLLGFNFENSASILVIHYINHVIERSGFHAYYTVHDKPSSAHDKKYMLVMLCSRTLPSASRAHIWNFWDGESKYSFLVVVSIPIALIESTMTSHRCTSPVSLFSAKRKAVSLVGLLHNAATVTTCEHASSPCTVTDATSGLDDLLCQLIIRYQ